MGDRGDERAWECYRKFYLGIIVSEMIAVYQATCLDWLCWLIVRRSWLVL